jgi:hypothetical protein
MERGTSRLSDSLANNSIGCLRDLASATKSSARQPVESNGERGQGKGKKGFPKGKKPQVSFSLGYIASNNTVSGHPPARRLENFKYVWLLLYETN